MVIRAALANWPVSAPPRVLFLDSAVKKPAIGEAVASLLRERGLRVDLQTLHCDRTVFLRRMKQSQLAVLLPTQQEGYYLPPLEAMRMGVAVVTCDCLGNRDHCRDEDTCLIAPAVPESLAAAALRCLADADLRAHLIARGSAQAERQVLSQERSRFLAILQSAVV